MENHKNEIDLLELLIKIYLYLKRYWWILGISIITGIVFTFIKKESIVKSYTSSMILAAKENNNYMYAVTLKEFQQRYKKNPAEEIIGIINQANQLIQNNNFEILAKKMNLPESDLKSLQALKCEYKFEKDEKPGNLVKIYATSSQEGIFTNLSKGIENLINNNMHVKTKISEDSVMLVNIITVTEKKIKELDSLQSKFLKDGKINDLIIFKDNSFFGESVMLFSLKEKLNNDLLNLKQAEIVEKFYVPKLKSASLKISLLLNSIIFLFIGFIIIFFIIFNKKAYSFEKNRKQS